MSKFLQEYGVIIVAVIIILAFIVLAGVFGDTISEAVHDILSDLFTKSGAVANAGNLNGGELNGGENSVPICAPNEHDLQRVGEWDLRCSICNWSAHD